MINLKFRCAYKISNCISWRVFIIRPMASNMASRKAFDICPVSIHCPSLSNCRYCDYCQYISLTIVIMGFLVVNKLPQLNATYCLKTKYIEKYWEIYWEILRNIEKYIETRKFGPMGPRWLMGLKTIFTWPCLLKCKVLRMEILLQFSECFVFLFFYQNCWKTENPHYDPLQTHLLFSSIVSSSLLSSKVESASKIFSWRVINNRTWM